MPSHAALEPQHVVILANATNPDSQAVARHYAMQRQISDDHIISLAVPFRDRLSRREYEELVVTPLRRILQDRRLASSTRVLVTTYGVPLRVDAPPVSDEDRRLLADAQSRAKTSRARLEHLQAELAKLILPESLPHPPASGQVVLEAAKAALFLSQIDNTWRAALEHVRRQGGTEAGQKAIPEFLRLTQQYGGWALLLPRRDADHSPPVPDPPQASAWRALLERTAPLWTGLPHRPLTTERQLLYRWAERLFGVRGVLELASAEIDLLTAAHADASLDSELSLLWWDPGLYSVAWRWNNPFFEDAAPRPDDPPILMVSRLDAPTAESAKGLVDKAMQAERSGLQGTIYFDARGLQPDGPTDTYGVYDHSLREAATLAKDLSSYDVVLDLEDRTMTAMPNVALYIGWYRLRSYEDVFSFRPGAIGFHMASAEAVTIHDPNERGWCKNALERGITATVGSVGEPYLDAFPEPARFTRLLLSGKYPLVEVYYLTSRYVSWRMVLFGDPLYKPPVSQPRSSAARSLRLPVAPSERPMGDPPALSEQSRRAYQQRLDALLSILKRIETERPETERPGGGP
ncbi:MAG: TIGR03790 family protein [Nitrospira sp.]|nr:TIGR03790 family protein [Nitrospira sp.]